MSKHKTTNRVRSSELVKPQCDCGSNESQRLVRPDPRAFPHFPPDSKCPICGTNDDGKTVLVQISGTTKDGIAEAKPMHLACAVAKQWDEDMGIALTWPNGKAQR